MNHLGRQKTGKSYVAEVLYEGEARQYPGWKVKRAIVELGKRISKNRFL